MPEVQWLWPSPRSTEKKCCSPSRSHRSKEPGDKELPIGGFQGDVNFVLYAFDAWARANNIVNFKGRCNLNGSKQAARRCKHI